MRSPKEIALGYGWTCPYCRRPKDEGQQTGVYYFGKAVCPECARILGAARRAADVDPGALMDHEVPRLLTDEEFEAERDLCEYEAAQLRSWPIDGVDLLIRLTFFWAESAWLLD